MHSFLDKNSWSFIFLNVTSSGNVALQLSLCNVYGYSPLLCSSLSQTNQMRIHDRLFIQDCHTKTVYRTQKQFRVGSGSFITTAELFGQVEIIELVQSLCRTVRWCWEFEMATKLHHAKVDHSVLPW